MSFFQINGIELPYPARGLGMQRQQFVDSARNANGQVVAQKINRRLFKFDGLEWKHLTASQWTAILREIEKFEGTVTFWNAYSPQSPNGGFETRKVYWGDASEEIHKINPATGQVLEYINCKANLIDMGY